MHPVDSARRRLLLVFAGLPLLSGTLAACSSDPSPKTAPAPRGDADLKLRGMAVRDEKALLRLHAATVDAHPELATTLSPMTTHHDDHLTALEADGPLPAAAGAALPEPDVPPDPHAALTAVLDAEAAAAEAHLGGCLRATGTRIAALLASIAGAEAGHASLPPQPVEPPTTWPDDATGGIEEMQAALAGEHACVWGFGVVGAHLPDDAQAAHDAVAAHRARRDLLSAMLRSAGVEPVAAQGSYALPTPVTDEASAKQLAATLEERLAALYADVVAAAPPALREFAAHGVVSTALAAKSWGGGAAAFPGLAGRIDTQPSTPTPTPSATEPG